MLSDFVSSPSSPGSTPSEVCLSREYEWTVRDEGFSRAYTQSSPVSSPLVLPQRTGLEEFGLFDECFDELDAEDTPELEFADMGAMRAESVSGDVVAPLPLQKQEVDQCAMVAVHVHPDLADVDQESHPFIGRPGIEEAPLQAPPCSQVEREQAFAENDSNAELCHIAHVTTTDASSNSPRDIEWEHNGLDYDELEDDEAELRSSEDLWPANQINREEASSPPSSSPPALFSSSPPTSSQTCQADADADSSMESGSSPKSSCADDNWCGPNTDLEAMISDQNSFDPKNQSSTDSPEPAATEGLEIVTNTDQAEKLADPEPMTDAEIHVSDRIASHQPPGVPLEIDEAPCQRPGSLGIEDISQACFEGNVLSTHHPDHVYDRMGKPGTQMGPPPERMESVSEKRPPSPSETTEVAEERCALGSLENIVNAGHQERDQGMSSVPDAEKHQAKDVEGQRSLTPASHTTRGADRHAHNDGVGSAVLHAIENATPPAGPQNETRLKPTPYRGKQTVPNPKRSTIAGQKLQEKKLSMPFRCPAVSAPYHDVGSSASSKLGASGPPRELVRHDKETKCSTTALQVATASKDSKIKHRTERASAQFKSPLTLQPSGEASLVRPTPTIQGLERKVQTLKRALKVVRQNEETVLKQLIAKWTEAGRDVAWEVWSLVRDATASETNWSTERGVAQKRKLQDGWGWDDGGERKKTGMGSGSNWGWESAPDSEREHEGEGGLTTYEHEAPIETEETEEEDARQETIGTMLMQLGICPTTLGWDEDEGCFMD